MILIRSIIKTIKNTTDAVMGFAGVGRGGEGVGGIVAQHYGFRSLPPVNAQVITLQSGNNSYAVAELAEGPYDDLTPGDTIIHGGRDNTEATLQVGYADTTWRIVQDTTTLQIAMDPASKTIIVKAMVSGVDKGVIKIDGNSGQLSLNNGNLTVDA